MMIKRIGIENFRIYKKHTQFDLVPITILIGQNNSGKSTLQKLLLLLKSSLKKEQKDDRTIYNLQNLVFNNEVIKHIGSFENNISYNSTNDNIIFTFSANVDYWGDLNFKLYFKYEKKVDYSFLYKIEIIDKNNILYRYSYIPIEDVLESYFQKDDSIDIDNEEFLHNKKEILESVKGEVNNAWILDIDEEQAGTFANRLYNILIEEKEKGVKQYYLFLLENKISRKKELTNFEKELRNEFEKQGIEFDSEEANYILSDMMDYFSNPHYISDGSLSSKIINPHFPLNIYDKNRKNVYKIDEILDKASAVYFDLDYRVLFPTKLSLLVLGESKLLSNSEIKDKHLLALKEKLLKSNIVTKKDFIENYQEFERNLIQLYIYSVKYDWSYYRSREYKDLTHLLMNERQFSNMFYNNSWFNNLDYLIEVLSNHKIIIAEILVSDLYKNNILKLDRNVGRKSQKYDVPKTTNEETYNLKGVFARAKHFLTLPVQSLLNDLQDFTQNMHLHYHNLHLKKIYRFDSDNLEDNLFLEFGKKLVNSNKDNNENNNSFINNWIKKFNLGENLIAEYSNFQNARIGVGFYVANKTDNLPIGDFGLGANQIIKLLIKIEMATRNSTFVVEEPESNLHPSFQSKLADLFVDAAKTKDVKFIVETHSEYLIKKLQYLVLNEKIEPDKIIINNFKKSNNKEPKIESININKNGELNLDLDLDFFDETTKLTTISDIQRQIKNKPIKCLVYAEDGNTKAIENLLISNGFNLNEVLLLSYDGKDNVYKAIFAASYIKDLISSIKKVIIHRDRDVNNEKDTPTINKEINNLKIKEFCTFFLTKEYDIEAYYLNPDYIHSFCPNIPIESIKSLIDEATVAIEVKSLKKIEDYLEDNDVKIKARAVISKAREMYNSNVERYRYSKDVYNKVVVLLNEKHEINFTPYNKSKHLHISLLKNIAKELWGN